MVLPKIPRLEKFCCCMEVQTGVKSFTIGLIVLWIIYALGAVVGTNSSKGRNRFKKIANYIKAVIAFVCNNCK